MFRPEEPELPPLARAAERVFTLPGRYGAQIAAGVMDTATAGLATAVLDAYGLQLGPVPTEAGEEVTRGVGQLAGFIRGPFKIAQEIKAATYGRFLQPSLMDPMGRAVAKSVAGEMATLSVATQIAAIGQGLQAPDVQQAVETLGEAGRSGALLGAVFGGAAIAPLTRATRIGVGSALLDVAQGRSPMDERSITEKAFDYALNAFFLYQGRDPVLVNRALAAEARRRSEASGQPVRAEDVLRSGLDLTRQRLGTFSFRQHDPERQAAVDATFAPLLTAAEVAETKTGGPLPSPPAGPWILKPELGPPAPEPIQRETLPFAEEAGLRRRGLEEIRIPPPVPSKPLEERILPIRARMAPPGPPESPGVLARERASAEQDLLQRRADAARAEREALEDLAAARDRAEVAREQVEAERFLEEERGPVPGARLDLELRPQRPEVPLEPSPRPPAPVPPPAPEIVQLEPRVARQAGAQGVIPGLPRREVPTTVLRTERPQAPLEETPLFGQERAAREATLERAQVEVPGTGTVIGRTARVFDGPDRGQSGRIIAVKPHPTQGPTLPVYTLETEAKGRLDVPANMARLDPSLGPVTETLQWRNTPPPTGTLDRWESGDRRFVADQRALDRWVVTDRRLRGSISTESFDAARQWAEGRVEPEGGAPALRRPRAPRPGPDYASFDLNDPVAWADVIHGRRGLKIGEPDKGDFEGMPTLWGGRTLRSQKGIAPDELVDEIATARGMSAQEVEARLHRALGRVQTAFAERGREAALVPDDLRARGITDEDWGLMSPTQRRATTEFLRGEGTEEAIPAPLRERIISPSSEEQAAIDRVTSLLSGEAGAFEPGRALSTETFRDLTLAGRYYLARGFRTFEQWAARMVQQFGDRIRAYLDQVWPVLTGERGAFVERPERRPLLDAYGRPIPRAPEAAALPPEVRQPPPPPREPAPIPPAPEAAPEPPRGPGHALREAEFPANLPATIERVMKRADRLAGLTRTLEDRIGILNSRAELIVPEAEILRQTGTLAPETRPRFREAGEKPETFTYRFSEQEIAETQATLETLSREYLALRRETERAAADPFAVQGVRVIQDHLADATAKLNAFANAFGVQRFAASRALKRFDRPIPDDVREALQAANLLTTWITERVKEPPVWWRRLDNVRRGLLVTQLATAVRNFETQVGRVGLDVLDQGMQQAWQRLFGKPVSAFPSESFDIFTKMFTPTGRRAALQTERVLEAFPREYARLFAQYSSDIQTGRGTRDALGRLEQTVELLNWANRFQEYLVRRAVFQTTLAARLERRGLNLADIIRRNEIRQIPEADIRAAVERALELTFAAEPAYGSRPYNLIRAVNQWPILLTGPIPFPRFMFNSLRFLYEFSPFGALDYLSASERRAFGAGNMRAISRASLGLGMMLGAWGLRETQPDDSRWYDFAGHDVRPFNPFAAYLFTGELIKRARQGTLYKLERKDVLLGILSANVRGGTGAYVFDKFLDELTAGSKGLLTRAAKTVAGEIIGGVFVPLRQLTDLLAQIDPQEAIVRNVREAPLTGPSLQNIPGAARELPERYSVTRSGPMRREAPMLRQATGLIKIPEKNPAERELDRLQFSYREIAGPSTGDPEADNLLAAHLGPLVETELSDAVEGLDYRRRSNAERMEFLKVYLKHLRARARWEAAQEAPEMFEEVKERRAPMRQRLLREERRGEREPVFAEEEEVQ